LEQSEPEPESILQDHTVNTPAREADLMRLGVVLGQNEAFEWIRGRCTAAVAANLTMLKESGKYKLLTPDWEDFCPNYLRISRSEADKTIRLFQEFGEKYFAVAQFTPISAQTYRAIEPAVKEGSIHCNGDVIDLVPENAKEVAAAVAQLRDAAKKKTPPTDSQRLLAIDKRFGAILAELAEFSCHGQESEHWKQFATTLQRMRAGLAQLAEENQM